MTAGRAVESLVPLAPGAATAGRKILQYAGKKAAGSAVEGALFVAGNVVKEAALGDPDLTAEMALAEIGTGAAIGGVIGGVLGGGYSVTGNVRYSRRRSFG
jgi:hypothetical protein